MEITKNVFIGLFLLMQVWGFGQQDEAWYINLLASQMGADKEVSVQNGRVDLVTETHAYEVEWAKNWKHSIGQALWYGLQTNKTPGIILIMKDISERKYGIMLQSAIDYAGLHDKINVMFHPEDFGISFTEIAQLITPLYEQNTNHPLLYSRNIKTGARHNSNCIDYDCKNCVACGSEDGQRGCRKCGG